MNSINKMFKNETHEQKLRLVIIADDMTGALDTGVQFSKRGAQVSLISPDELSVPQDADVLVIDAETRHVAPKRAYEITRRIVKWAYGTGVPYVYIKTDSGLRGNIGPALKGALDASGVQMAAFAPAYPEMNRITQDGYQLIDGIPIAQSVFGADPVNPVKESRVSRLIEWEGLRTVEIGKKDVVIPADRPSVYIFDAEEDSDLCRIRDELKLCGGLRLTAGCAAFAQALIPAYGLPEETEPVSLIEPPLLVICGSLNPITRRQLQYGIQHGAWHFSLRSASLLNETWPEIRDGLLLQIRDRMQQEKDILISTDGGISDGNPTQTSQRIAAEIGKLVHWLLDLEESRAYTPMIIGGDTLMGFFAQQRALDLRIEGEILPGVVLFCIRDGNRWIRMMSKSGGFGSETLLRDVLIPNQQIKERS